MLADAKAAGFEPIVIVETSPNNSQAWLLCTIIAATTEGDRTTICAIR